MVIIVHSSFADDKVLDFDKAGTALVKLFFLSFWPKLHGYFPILVVILSRYLLPACFQSQQLLATPLNSKQSPFFTQSKIFSSIPWSLSDRFFSPVLVAPFFKQCFDTWYACLGNPFLENFTTTFLSIIVIVAPFFFCFLVNVFRKFLIHSKIEWVL